MYQFDPSVVPVIAGDTNSMLRAADRALLANARLMSSVIESVENADLPINVSQEIFESIHASGTSFLEGRQHLRQSIRRLRAVAKNSPHHARMVGCPDGLPESAYDRMSPSRVPSAILAE